MVRRVEEEDTVSRLNLVSLGSIERLLGQCSNLLELGQDAQSGRGSEVRVNDLTCSFIADEIECINCTLPRNHCHEGRVSFEDCGDEGQLVADFGFQAQASPPWPNMHARSYPLREQRTTARGVIVTRLQFRGLGA